MSSLAQQLSQLKQSNGVSIAPGAARPSLILDKTTARNTTIDVLFTMAVMGYTEIKKQVFQSGRNLAEQLLSEQNKELNRNKLSKEENKVLSAKLTRFMIILSGLFLNRGCQSIMEYLLRNYNVHVFEPEQVALIFLQYWQQPIYAKLISNIQIKTPNLQFLKPLQSPTPTSPTSPNSPNGINFTYILKSLTFSRTLLTSLLLFTRKYIKQQYSESQQFEIDLISKPTSYQNSRQIQVEDSTIVKKDVKQFVLQVLGALLDRRIDGFDKEIQEFCLFLAKQSDQDVYSMAMIISLALLAKQKVHSEWIDRVLHYILSKSPELSSNVFNFVIIIWQRWPTLITHKLISLLLQKQHFILHMVEFTNSLSIPFYMLFQDLLKPASSLPQAQDPTKQTQNKGLILQILRPICLKIKQQQFVRVHQSSYFTQIFNIFHQNIGKLEKKVRIAVCKFVGETLAYQYAGFVLQAKLKCVQEVFGKEQLNKDGSFNWKLIQRVVLEKQAVQDNENNAIEEQVSSEQQQQMQQVPKSSLLTLLQTHLQTPLQSLQILTNPTPKLKQAITKILTQYYTPTTTSTSTTPLSQQHKNKLLQNPEIFNELYNVDWFYCDLDRRDYHTAIRYLGNGTVDMCGRVLGGVCADGDLAGDMLYRELCRLAAEKLAQLSLTQYKAVINTLAKLYHRYCKNSQPELTKPLNELMLRLSNQVLSRAGRQKGKFYKLIACHSHFLATLTMSNIYSQHYALETYNRLLDIFGQENGYCFVIGVAEILATKVKNKKMFGNFIQRVLIPALIGDTHADQTDFKNIMYLFNTVNKCLVFCWHMLQSAMDKQQSGQKEEIDNGSEPGVAKKMIAHFFGLTTPKNRRAIVRKIFMFLSSLFKSPKVSAMFRQCLSTINRKQEVKLCSITSKIYCQLIKVYNNSAGPLKVTCQIVRNNLLKLYPLELKIDVLGPLLPLNQVYEELGNDLSEHNNTKFDNLAYFVNIVPNKPSDQWCKFATQCIRRSYIPCNQTSTKILELYDPQQQNNTNIVKFICSMSEFARQDCLELLDKMMDIVFNQTTSPNSYALAIFYALTKNLKEFIHPYLTRIFAIAIQVEDDHVRNFVDGVVQAFTAPTLVDLAKTHAKSVNNIQNFSYFLNRISQKVTFESIWKTCQNFFGRSLTILIQNSQSFQTMQQQQSQVFMSQALKMNESQLRKVIIDYVRWSSERTSSDDAAGLMFNSRKCLLMIVFEKLCEKLGDIFTHFFGYVFEDIVKDLKTLRAMSEQKSIFSQKNSKRDRQVSEYSLQCTKQYTQQLLLTLKSLFEHDPNNEFMDSIKFDTLTPQLCNIFNLTKFDHHYSNLITNYLQPCLMSLFKNTVDDYKLKTANTEILRMLRTKDQRITQSIFGFYNELVAHIDYRFLLFTDEMVPLLIEATSSRNAGVKKFADSIVQKIQNLSGQKINKINASR